MTTERIDIVVTGRGVRRVRRDISDIGTAANVSQGSVKLLRRALVALGGTVVLVGAVRTLANFSQEMSTVQAITQATTSDFDLLQDKAKELGATTRFSASQAAEGMKFLARAGFDADEVLNSIAGTLQLAQAGALDLGRAADIASNVLQGFRLEVDQTARVVDVLALAANSSNTNVEQLGDAMKFVAPVASGVGVSLEEATAAAGALSNAGLQASLAGTGLRRVLSELESPSAKTVKVLNQLGVSANEVRISQVGLTRAMERLRAAGVDTGLALEIFGDRGGPAFEVLSSSIDDVKKMTAALREADGTAERIAETMDDNLNGALLATKSALEAVVLAIGELGATSFLTEFFNSMAVALRWIAANIDLVVNALGVMLAAWLALKLGSVLIALISIGGVLPLIAAGLAALTGPLGIALALGAAVLVLSANVKQLREEERNSEGVLVSIARLRREAAQATGEQAEAIREKIRASIEEKRLEIELERQFQERIITQIEAMSDLQENFGNIAAEAFLQGKSQELEEARLNVRLLNKDLDALRESLESVGATPRFGEGLPGGAPPPTRRPDGVSIGDTKTFGDMLRQLDAETQALRASTLQREIRAEVLEFEDELNRRLTQSEREQVEVLAAQNFQYRLQQSVMDELNGPQENYLHLVQAINEAVADGLIVQADAVVALRDARIAFLETERTFLAGLERALLKMEDNVTNFADIAEGLLTSSFNSASEALVEFVRTGKLDFQSLIDDMITQLARLATNQIFAQLFGNVLGDLLGGGAAGLPTTGNLNDFSFANGGSFTVGPNTAAGTVSGGDIDNRLIMLRARDGERVSVSTPGRSAGGSGVSVTIINNAGAEVSTRTSRGGNGKINLEVLVDEAAALAISTPNSATQRALQGSMGVSRTPIRRG